MPARLRRTEALPPRPHFSLPWMSRLSSPPSQASFRRKRRFIQWVLAEHLGCSPPKAAAASSPAPALMDAQAREAAPSKGAHSSELAAWLREAGGGTRSFTGLGVGAGDPGLEHCQAEGPAWRSQLVGAAQASEPQLSEPSIGTIVSGHRSRSPGVVREMEGLEPLAHGS